MSVFFDPVKSILNHLRLGNSVAEPDKVVHCCLSENQRGTASAQRLPRSAINPQSDEYVRISVVSDTHERHYLLDIPPCDVLVYAGDMFMEGRLTSTTKAIHELKQFNEWIGQQPARYKLVIAGNHDRVLEKIGEEQASKLFTNAIYLCNTAANIEGLRIFGTPLSHGASGNSAFQSVDFLNAANSNVKELLDKEGPVDVLITHGTCGTLAEAVQPRLVHIHGHIHAMHGVHVHASRRTGYSWYRVAAPIMDRHYRPTQVPIVIDVPRPDANA
jgi:Icc-related predicted phosphoesterase